MLPEAARYKKEWQAAQQARLDSGVDTDSFVYLHVNADNGIPHYVGIGFKKGRPWELGRNNKHRNKVAKHGLRVEIIADNLTWEQACFWEVHWIKALRTAGYALTNLTDGGDGVKGYRYTDEQKRALGPKIKEALALPENRDRHLDSFTSPERSGKISAAQLELWRNLSEEERKAKIEIIVAASHTEEAENKRKITNAFPEVKERKRLSSKEVQQRPGVKLKQQLRAEERWQNPVYAEQQAVSSALSWKDNDIRNSRVCGMRRAWALRSFNVRSESALKGWETRREKSKSDATLYMAWQYKNVRPYSYWGA